MQLLTLFDELLFIHKQSDALLSTWSCSSSVDGEEWQDFDKSCWCCRGLFASPKMSAAVLHVNQKRVLKS